MEVEDYRSIAYSRYSSNSTIDYNKIANAYRRRFGSKVTVDKSWHCLDIACGYGNFLAYFRNNGNINFVGVDYSEGATASARQQFGEAHVLCIDIFKYLSETKERFDFISALDFVEHLNKDELILFLTLLKSVHKPKGMLLLRTPNAAGLFGMAARYNDITHEISFTPSSIADVLNNAGYRVIRVWDDAPTRGNPFQTGHWILWGIVKNIIRIINTVETGCWGDGVLARNMWVLAQKEEN